MAHCGYIVVLSGAGLPSQCDLVNLLQLLWLLFYHGVPSTFVKAFLWPVLGKSIWPSARSGGLPLTPPPGYEVEEPEAYREPGEVRKAIVTDRRDLNDCVGRQIALFSRDPEVSGIFLASMDHGPEMGVDMTGEEILTAADFAGWARLAHSHNTPLFAVVDACNSTRFAECVWTKLGGRERRDTGAYACAKNFGILSSGHRTSFASATIVSKEADLVYPLDDPVQCVDGWVMGFKVNSSMFFRQLLWLLTYGLSDKTISLADFAARMNEGKGYFSNGFRAEVTTFGDAFAGTPLNVFFPFGVVTADTVVNGFPGDVTFDEIIPSARPGVLYDEMEQFWEQEKDESQFQFRFVEARRNASGQVVGGVSGLLNHVPAFSRICGEMLTQRVMERGDEAEEAVPEVPLGSVYHHVLLLAEGEGAFRRSRDDVDDAYLRQFESFLKSMYRRVTPRDTQFVWPLAQYEMGIGEARVEEFRAKVREVWESLTKGELAP
jgi:hypothetical protein